jgi:uncharacterized damage-inducible protein DinB
MRVAEIRTLYDYHYWANGRICEAATRITPEQFVAPAPVPWGSIRGTLVHTLGAERSWLARWEGRAPPPRPADDEFPTIAAVIAAWGESEARIRAFIAGLDDEALDRDFAYTRYSGERRVQPLWQLLVHVVNHGTQHRSEVAVLLTMHGASPGDLDLSLAPLGRNS